jgi:hypothetical protein
LEAHWADLASVLVGPMPVPEVLKVFTAIDAGQIEEHFIDRILLDFWRHIFQSRHDALAEAVIYVEWKIYTLFTYLMASRIRNSPLQ